MLNWRSKANPKSASKKFQHGKFCQRSTGKEGLAAEWRVGKIYAPREQANDPA
jgi:hypothetical protein